MESHKRYINTFLLTIVTLFGFIQVNALTPCMPDKHDKAANSRSDTIDILRYFIDLDMTNFSAKTIVGDCQIQLTPKKNNINILYFDLLKLTVDSVVYKGVQQVFSHNDTLLKINLSSTIGILDTVLVSIYYRGAPVRDLSWGGFYYQGNYAYNLGVGFDANPHNYGRIWFPCFDNFVERSAYTFKVRTAGGKKAHCNGHLIAETPLAGDTIERTWEMDEEIPTYLACVAVADYETIHMNHNGMAGVVPIEIAAREPDTTNVKNSFIHLPDAIDAFENSFGPYLFGKVGYSIVPFNAGAMEHATNIAYPRYAVNGSLTNETLMAHELAHHWWGNLVTCENPEDMWLNEGMASYCEHLFLEHTYGTDRYWEAVQQNHTNVLQYAHIRENEYRAISGVPHNYTYGMHVYDKGASVAHTLRGYMGDSLFFAGTKSFLATHQFSSITSTLLRDELMTTTGVDLTNFFRDWVFNAGFPHFSIDSMTVVSTSGNYDVTIYIRQKTKGAPSFYQQVPMNITFWDENMTAIDEQVMLSGATDVLNFSLPIEPVYAALNTNGAINQAITADQMIIKDADTYNFNFGKMEVNVTSLTDSALMRVEHHWVEPDQLQNNPGELRMSDYRYWSVDGITGEGFSANAVISFDGRNITNGGDGHLDFDLLRSGEDSLLLMHRSNAGDEWREFRYYTVNSLGSPSDRYGEITIDSLLMGEYALAKGPSVVGKSEIKENNGEGILIFPNPANDQIQIKVGKDLRDLHLTAEILDINGKLIDQGKFSGKTTLPIKHLVRGTYLVVIKHEYERLKSEKVLVN